MNKLCIFVGTVVGGSAGCVIGSAFGLGFGASFLLSGCGSLLGVWLGWKVARALE